MGIRFIAGMPAALMLAAALAAGCREQVRRSNPELIKMALQVADQGDWREARSLSWQAVQQNPEDANARVSLARVLEQEGQHDQALTELDRAVELDQQHFAAQYNRGRILYEHDRLQDSLVPLAKALALRPDSVETRQLLARACAQLGKHRDAAGHYVALARHPRFARGGEIYNELALLLLSAGDKDKAAKFMLTAHRNAPENPTVNYNYAVLCDAHLAQPRQAVDLYRRYLELTAGNNAFAVRRDQVEARLRKLTGG